MLLRSLGSPARRRACAKAGMLRAWPGAGPWPWACPAPRRPSTAEASNGRSATSPAIRPPTRHAGCSASWPPQAPTRPGPDRSGRPSPASPRAGSTPGWPSSRSIANSSSSRRSIPTATGSRSYSRRPIAFTRRTLRQAHSETEKSELLLARARLDLTPRVGRPRTLATCANVSAGCRERPPSITGRGCFAWSPWSRWDATSKPSAKPRATRPGEPLPN